MELISGLNSIARSRLHEALEAWQACEGLSLVIRIRKAVGSQGYGWTPTQWVEWINNHSVVRLKVNQLNALGSYHGYIGDLLVNMNNLGPLFSSWGQLKMMAKMMLQQQLKQLRAPERRIFNAVVKQLREISFNPPLPLELSTSWTSSVGTSPLWAASLISQL